MGKVLLVITIGAMVLPSSARVSGQTCEPTLLSVTDVFPASEPVRHVAVFGDTAVVATDDAIKVLDVSNPFVPVIQGELRNLDQFGLAITDIAMNKDVAIYANRSNHLWLIDLSDPNAPRAAGFIAPDFDFIHAVEVEGTTAYAVGNDLPVGGTLLHVLDISNPDAPSVVGLDVVGPMDAKSLAVLWPRAYVGGKFHNNATDFISILSFDISDNTNPQFLYQTQVSTTTPVDSSVNTIDIAATSTFTFPITRRDLYAIEADSGTARATTHTLLDFLAVGADERHLFVSESGVGLLIYDLANSTFPASFGLSCNTWMPSLAGVDIDLADSLIYVCGGAVNDLAILSFDTDGDGLLDDWEDNGIPYLDSVGVPRRYVLPNADRLSKDLYVEVDAMAGFSLSDAAVTLLETAFAFAPLTNPDPNGSDGIDGITLHVLRDETDLPHVQFWQTAPPKFCWPADFDAKRRSHYGTQRERGFVGLTLLEAKAKAYRYCIVADGAGPNLIGGCGQMPGDNFVIFINGYDDDAQAAVFMHELGHNLSLDHGGGDGVHHGKPNYPSIMNYVLSYRYNWNTLFWTLDYSREEAGNFVSLNESSLDELVGIGTPGGLYSDFEMPFGVNELDANSNTIRVVKYVTLDGSDTDFGHLDGMMSQDGSFDFGVAQDLNYVVNPPPGITLPSVQSFPQTLEPYDDWANVGLPLAAALGAGAPAISYPTDELTIEAIEWIDANFPLPPGACLADLDDNGAVGPFDLAFVLGHWGPNPGHPADLDGDGEVGPFDLALVLGNWGPCE